MQHLGPLKHGLGSEPFFSHCLITSFMFSLCHSQYIQVIHPIYVCPSLYTGSHILIPLFQLLSYCAIHIYVGFTMPLTCLCQYPLYTVMVFDDWRNGIPVAFFAISRSHEQDLVPVLQALHNRVASRDPTWCPSSIIVDNAQAELNTLR